MANVWSCGVAVNLALIL